ncbi:MAG: hypothetical protein ACP5OZ_04210 [Candidatus Woesearchaeota archaeon]
MKIKKRGVSKAQSAEFISIVLLIIVITLFALFNKLSSGKKSITNIQTLTTEVKTTDVQLVTVVLPYTTKLGIPLSELLGTLSCYGNDTVDYGAGIKISILQEIRTKLDELYGKDNWILFLKSGIIEFPPLYFYVDSSNSMSTTINAVDAAMRSISSKYKKVTIAELTTAKGAFSNGRDDLKCGLGDNHDFNCDWEENWGGAVAFVAKNGPPPYDGWNESEEKIIFISGDEESCSSDLMIVYYGGRMLFCGGCCHNTPGNTPAYAELGLKAAKENGVRVYFLVPPQLFLNDPKRWQESVKKLCEETGGQMIRVNVDNPTALRDQIAKNVEITYKSLYITSSYNGTEKKIPDKDFMSYDFVYPLPCSPSKRGEGSLMVARG